MRLLLLAALSLSVACASDSAEPESTQDAPWISLFDGETTAGWRGFKRDEAPAGWQVVDGALTRVAEGGDLITEETFANFEFELEWRISERGNSGIFFRLTEDHDATYFTAPEMQVLDDAVLGADEALHSAGANYGLHAPVGKTLAPVGEWNQVRLVVDGAHVEHWLNGTKVVEYELWSEDWKALVAASKFSAWPAYGQNRGGHLGLQDHGNEVAYRNLRVRRLP